MPVCEQEYEDGVLQQTRVNFLGARGIEVVVTVDHTRGNQASLSWLLCDGHGNLVRTMAPDYRLSAFQWRGVWGEVQGSLGTGRGYCANLGHPEDETGLVYMRARYYEPATGRFISEDSSRDGVNWYLYASGNPVNRVDPSGNNDEVRAIARKLANWLWMFSVVNNATALASCLMALYRFLDQLSQANDWLDVELSWGDFMQSFGKGLTAMIDASGYLQNSLTFIRASASVLSGIGRSSSFASVAQLLITALLVGSQLAILSYAYQLRIAFYLDSIGDE
jgi:RHS repeat-associated protein